MHLIKSEMPPLHYISDILPMPPGNVLSYLCRRAAAACYGLSERSDQVWAYNKATVGTGGLAVLLLLGDEELANCAETVFCPLLFSWSTKEFWAALQDLFHQLEKARLVSQEQLVHGCMTLLVNFESRGRL